MSFQPEAMVERAGREVTVPVEEETLTPVSADRVAEAAIVLVICVIIILANVLMIATVVTSPMRKEAMDYYLLSLAVADLLCGVLIVPLSVYPAVVRDWVYGNFLCRLSGYIEITLWSVSIYTFMWISVDRYLAMKKPLRYETIQTQTRCQCWMVFTWITSMFLCSPPLLSFSKGQFYKDGYICISDLGSMLPYSITLAILILVPSIVTIAYTYIYIFLTMHKLKQCMTQEEKEQAIALGESLSNPDHIMAFVLTLLFCVSWMPWLILCLWEYATEHPLDNHPLHFSLLWIGFLHGSWKPIVCAIMGPKFRFNLKMFCLSIWCRQKTQQQLIV